MLWQAVHPDPCSKRPWSMWEAEKASKLVEWKPQSVYGSTKALIMTKRHHIYLKAEEVEHADVRLSFLMNTIMKSSEKPEGSDK